MSPAFSIFALFIFATTGSVFGQRRITTSVQTGVDFDCPDEFGYYPHPADCTQYYVCVFGGALLESCTGGLMYSHELQTCDWPRNVGCTEAGAEPIESATASSVTRAEPISRGRTTSGAAQAPSRSSSSRGLSQQQHRQQQQQRQDELVKQQLYADELGPAEEIESDRQQRVYRGQPSNIGQVARDRDGLGQTRHQVTNAIPASRDKLQYQTQQQPQQQAQQQQTQYHRVEVTREPPPPQPQQQQVYIVQQTSPRAPLYNTSRHQAANTYDGQQYDLYNLYDEDVELYRDTDYGQYAPNPQSVPSRGRQPIVDVYQQQQPATHPPAPIQQDYQNTYQLDPEVLEYETVSVRPQIKTPSRSTPAAAALSPDPSLKTTTSTTTTPTPSIPNKTPRSLIDQSADAEVEPRIITHSDNPSRVSQNQKITLSATLSIKDSNSTRKTLPRGPEIVTVDSFITEEGKLARRRVTIKKPINTTPLPLSKGRGRLTYQESLSREDSSSYEDSGSYEDYSSSREDSSSTERTLVTRPRERETNSVVDNESTTLRSRYIRPVFADVEDFDDDAKDALRRHPIHEGISGNNRGVPIRITRPITIPDFSEEENKSKLSLRSKENDQIKFNAQGEVPIRIARPLTIPDSSDNIRSKSSLRPPIENVQIKLNGQGEVPIRIARPPITSDFSEDDNRSKSSLRPPIENVQIKLNAQGEVPIRIARPPITSDFSEDDNRSKSSLHSSKENVEIQFNPKSFVRPRIENESNKSVKTSIFPKEEIRKSTHFSSAERPSIERTSSEIDDSEIETLSRNQGHNSFTTSSHEEKENIRATEFNQPSKSLEIERGYRRPLSDQKSSNLRTNQETLQSDVYKSRKIEENNRYNSRTKVGKENSDSQFDNKHYSSRTAQEKTQEFNQPKLIEHTLDTTRFPIRINTVSESPKTNWNSKLRGEAIRQPSTLKPNKEFFTSVREKAQPENDVIQNSAGRPRPVESYIPQTLPSGTTPIPLVTSQSTPMHNATSEKNDRDCNNDRQCRDKNKIRQQITNTRNRGSSAYTTGGLEAPLPSQQTVNRGTPASVRSRPTLKPSTAIVSKAQEFIDIYRFPPSRPEPVYPTPTPDKTAAKCRKDVCLLPDCNCGGKDIPGDYNPENIPQMVLLTFDDSVNDLNKGLYSDLFEKGRRNPNGCPISATFYVSHEWTDYSQVQNLYADGHEMASHSVSHSFGEQFSQKKWNREIGGQREILSAYGGVKLEDVRGMRAPFLAVGGNKMFKMLYDSNFTYDSSMPVYENRPPSWPYTLDYKLFHDCMIPPCPTRSYPGVWEVPMVMWQDLNGGRCSMGDACSNPPTADGVYKMLVKNFERHYTTNRAPFGLFYHAAWFTQPHHKEAFISFIDTINAMKDVWLVTNWQALQWIRDPTPNDRLTNFQPFQCNYPDRPKRCNNPKVCNLWHKSGVRYMRTCQPCPDIYPWTGKTGVRNSRVDNEIEE